MMMTTRAFWQNDPSEAACSDLTRHHKNSEAAAELRRQKLRRRCSIQLPHVKLRDAESSHCPIFQIWLARGRASSRVGSRQPLYQVRLPAPRWKASCPTERPELVHGVAGELPRGAETLGSGSAR